MLVQHADGHIESRLSEAVLDNLCHRYKEASGTVTELSQKLNQVTEELESINAQMEERTQSMSDSTPLSDIKKSLNQIKKETAEMDLRIGVVQHILMASSIRNKGELVATMNATVREDQFGDLWD
eukprot:TRINITY_DN7977_c0_g1_i4.p2 TRINITY_DN7977_c0_g1~~TRINITY_DN7977_c0_g1_i4.p2  ORF type:complete len:125 (+),score=32.38 TRINITY_DN7977_c0_g1_i4:975-1349(+)